jgi:hypothetical protein
MGEMSLEVDSLGGKAAKRGVLVNSKKQMRRDGEAFAQGFSNALADGAFAVKDSTDERRNLRSNGSTMLARRALRQKGARGVFSQRPISASIRS